MGTADAGRFDWVADGRGTDAVGTDGSGALQLVRAAATLRWSRPDLTATLAELAIETAADAATWVAAAGWLLHGRAALGDGRETACDLLDGLRCWGDAGVELMGGPVGRRLRVELSGPARRIGELDVARCLLDAEPGADDPELRADVVTELARGAVDDDPDEAEEALRTAERAWHELACPPGVAAVKLLSAARERQAGRADAAVEHATDGLQRLTAGGRRAEATASDHVAAALTAEWIAALVEAGRLDEARSAAVPAATRLIATARTGRQTAGLRLALARITAVAASPEAVLAALDAAAQDAADSDVPELESACRSMLGELHEAAGRLDVALGAVRAAMAAERRDRDRGSRLHARLTAAGEAWASRASRRPTAPSAAGPSRSVPVRRDDPLGPWPAARLDARDGGSTPSIEGVHPERDDRSGDGGVSAPPTPELLSSGPATPFATARDAAPRNGADPEAAGGRRARRLAAEASGGEARLGATPASYRDGDGAPAGDPSSTYRLGSPDRDVASSGRWGGSNGGSLIGDALLREFARDAAAVDGGAPPTQAEESDRHGPGRNGARNDLLAPADDPLFGRRPDDDGRRPDPDARRPDHDGRRSGPDGHGPDPDVRRPGHDGRRSGPDGRGPDLDARRSDLDGRRSDPDGRRPGHDGRRSGPGGRRSDPDARSPGHDGRGLDADARRPDADARRPDADARRPDPDRRRPDVDGADAPGLDSRTLRWDTTSAWADRASSADGAVGDTVVLGTAGRDGPPAPPSNGSAPGSPTDPPADRATGEPSGPGRRGSTAGQPGRRGAADTDGLGLADLLAGALAAYRNL